jgi:hypothetical protein
MSTQFVVFVSRLLLLLAHIQYRELFLKGLAMAAKIGGHT